jgi:hypothetical protein
MCFEKHGGMNKREGRRIGLGSQLGQYAHIYLIALEIVILYVYECFILVWEVSTHILKAQIIHEEVVLKYQRKLE